MWTPDPSCPATVTLVTCELSQVSPRYSLISTGTNDESFQLGTGAAAVERISDIIAEVRRNRSVPVLLTIPPRLDLSSDTRHWQFAVAMNQAIVKAATQNRVPLLNVWRALATTRMKNFGMEPGGLHLQTFRGYSAPDALQNSVNFRSAPLTYGNNRRNLLILQLLKRLDGQVRSLRRQ